MDDTNRFARPAVAVRKETMMTNMTWGRCLAALALGLALIGGPAIAQAPQPDRAQIEKIVRDYLLANPEVIQDALQELERRQQDAQRQAQANAVKAERQALIASPHDTVIGNPKGDVTMVEFFDYNCGFCKRASADIEALIKSDPNLRVVLKDFPVLGPDSVEASLVSVAVRSQLPGERMYEFHRRLMDSRGRVTKDRALALAKEMGVDVARLQKEMETPQVRQVLSDAMTLGDKLSLTGTPAFVIGDEVVFGAVGVEALRSTITGVRQCGKASC